MAVWLNFYNFLLILLISCSYGLVEVSQSERRITFTDHGKEYQTTILLPNEKIVKNDTSNFNIFCYRNTTKSILQIWKSVHLVLLNPPPPYDYAFFTGINETEVYKNYKSKSVLWHPSFWFSGSDTVVEFPAFSKYCVGIASDEKFAVQFNVRFVNYWKTLQTAIGVLLFLTAPSFSRNPIFHYAAGVCLGVVASLLVLIYFVSRIIPKKSASYLVLIFGYSFILYVLQLFWFHFTDIVLHYMDIVIGYSIICALISFLVCYRFGPVKSTRTCNIIQWSVQGIGLILIFFSSEYREVSTAIILILFVIRLFPPRWIAMAKYLWYKCFPPKVRLLTDMEYIEQGHVETRKALDNLRQYCSSPDCDVWKVVSRLKDPARFANFIESGSHCNDQELLAYASEDILDSGPDESESEEELSESTSID